jgi:hypothetical protein
MMKSNPEIAQAYSLYTMCRQQTMFTATKSKGQGKDARTIQYVLPYPSGYAQLPDPGGMLDQPYRLMEFFALFMRAERHVIAETLSK